MTTCETQEGISSFYLGIHECRYYRPLFLHVTSQRFIPKGFISLCKWNYSNKASVFSPQHHKLFPHEDKFSHRAFSLPRVLLFSAKCLISLICSNTIRLSVFSGQTFHSTGGVSQCTFHLFLMAGPSGIGLTRPLPLAHWSVAALSSSEGSPDGEGKRLEVEVVLSLSTILWLLRLPSLLWGQDVLCVLCLHSSRALHWAKA